MNMNVNQFYTGCERKLTNGVVEVRQFKFTPEDVGMYIVMKFRYEQHMFWGSMLGTKLQVNGQDPEELYGVYKIEWHADWCKYENNMKYKVKLTPVGNWGAWCPNRSWYTSDIESMINHTFNLFEETPIFDNPEDATEFALTKNFEMYPKEKKLYRFFKTIFK